jgi:hypothetical protein
MFVTLALKVVMQNERTLVIILLYTLRCDVITAVGHKLQSTGDMPLCSLVSVYQISGKLASSVFGLHYIYRQQASYFGFL